MNALYLTLAYFLIYSFLGWCCEVIYCTLNSGTFVNRGFLNGPYCPIYGFGMVGILALLEPVFDNMPLLFLGATLITSSIELAGGWILYKLFHARWWDYSKKPFNLGGYICAEFSLIWGLATLGVIKFLHPVVTLLVTRMIPDFLKWPFVILGCLIMAVDTAASAATAVGLNRKLKELDGLNKALRRHSDVLSNILGAAAFTVDQIKDEQQLQLLLGKAEAAQRLGELKEEAGQRLEDLKADLKANAARRSQLMKRLGGTHLVGPHRMLDAFPSLKSSDYSEALSLLRSALDDLNPMKK